MSPFSHLPRLAVIAALGVAVVFACGPFFGIEVLQNREQVLLAPPSVSFEAELKALAPPPQDKLPVMELGDSDSEKPNRTSVEAGELVPAALARVSAMRAQTRGDAAYAVGEELSTAIRLYTAGAVSFASGENEAAQAYFQKILALPEQERKQRELWANFMLGRIAVQEANQSQASVRFEAVRELVRHGSPDPLGLAVASFGEQARVAWNERAVANAVELYARQASYGSQSGANSLVTIAGLILKDPALLDQGIQDPVTRRLLFICLTANSGRRFFVGPDLNADAASEVDAVVAALERHRLTQVEGAGLLASAAYSQARFDLAQKLSALEDVPISDWVKAKLALRRGDSETALKEYERALKTFQPSMGDPASVRTEYAALRVSHGDYVQALDLFYGAERSSDSEWDGFSDYWGDAAYLAERVLTIEELRNYLDHALPSASDSLPPGKSARSRLRSVLARRLMRAGRRSEAIRYFDDPNVRSEAEQYDRALNKANSWWRLRLTRAESWFTAATLARSKGMELLGFEKEPDFAIWNGAFDSPNEPPATATNLYESEDERKRVANSKPERDMRFQYRMTAVDHAMKSADLLPARSQAFAAVLCQATRWVIDRQPKEAERVYQRYLHQGAHVAWGRSFGGACPPPDFRAASSWSTASRGAHHLARRARAHPVYAALPTVLILAILTGLFMYLRARPAKHRLASASDDSSAQT